MGKSKTPVEIRHSYHKREIQDKLGGLSHHYRGSGGCGYDNISIIIIEKVEKKNLNFLAERETFWQH